MSSASNVEPLKKSGSKDEDYTSQLKQSSGLARIYWGRHRWDVDAKNEYATDFSVYFSTVPWN